MRAYSVRSGRLGVGGAGEAVDRVRRDHDDLSGADGIDRARDLLVHRRPSTTRSRPVRSAVTRTSWYPSDSSSAIVAAACLSVDLEDERTVRGEDVHRARRNRLGVTRLEKRGRRLELDHLRREPVALVGAHVRRVRDDEVPRPRREPVEQVVWLQLDGETGARGVLAGEPERVLGDVDAGHPCPWVLVGDRERDRPGAGADVEHGWRLCSVEQCQAALHDDLGLGPGDQSAPVDRERQPAEAPLAEHVLQRLAPGSSRDELARDDQLVVAQRSLELHVQLDPLQPEGLREQPLRVEPRCLRPRRRQVVGGTP